MKSPKPVKHYTDDEPNLLTGEEAWTGLEKPLRFVEDLDEEKGLIRICRNQYRQELSPATKSGKNRTVPLVKELASLLTEHRRALLKAQNRGLQQGWVFPSDTGELMHSGQLNKPLTIAAKAAGISFRITPHGLRRTFNNLVRQVEADAIVIRSITGHSTEQMREHYSHVGAEEKKRAQSGVIALTTKCGR